MSVTWPFHTIGTNCDSCGVTVSAGYFLLFEKVVWTTHFLVAHSHGRGVRVEVPCRRVAAGLAARPRAQMQCPVPQKEFGDVLWQKRSVRSTCELLWPGGHHLFPFLHSPLSPLHTISPQKTIPSYDT